MSQSSLRSTALFLRLKAKRFRGMLGVLKGSMVEIVQAVYKNGAFTPLAETHVPDGVTVRLVIESDDDVSSPNSLSLAMGVYDGLSDKDIQEVEAFALDRNTFFNDVKNNE